MVNNDLENIPYTMVLSWCALFCIYLSNDNTTDKLAMTHVVLYTTFVLCRIGHSLSYSYGYSMIRSIVWAIGILCSFGLSINGCIASFHI